MIINPGPTEQLKQLLNSYTENDQEFWAFRKRAVREHTHSYFQYPAMMVPQMQGQLIEAVTTIIPDTKHVFDPFVGSGTIMTEAMMRGLDFTGYDINPLAILICRAKIGPFYSRILQDSLTAILEEAKSDQSLQIDIDFPGRDKWFQPQIAIELSRIRRAICNETEQWCRRFCWVALAEVVRLSSNSRTSTFKLHIRTIDDIKKRDLSLSPIELFENIVKKNLNSFSKQKKLLEEHKLIKNGLYQGCVEVKHRDSSVNTDENGLYDLLVTSPPYGDNVTTVPYGQHSFLPLQWIDLSDIDEDIDSTWIKTTNEIDRRSLGGSRNKALEHVQRLSCLSESFKIFLDELKNEPRDRQTRVAAFCRDLDGCIDPILASLKSGAYMIWTVGNRRVGNRLVPIDQILIELLEARGASFVTKLCRTIPSKRMAPRNKSASTMRAENILVLKKGNT